MEIILNALKFTVAFILVFGGALSAIALLMYALDNWSTRWSVALVALYIFIFSILVQLDI